MKDRDEIDIQVGARLRYRRLSLGMSQEALAEAVGLRFQQIQKYEKGQNKIGASRLFRLAQALKVPLEYFFEDAEQLDVGDLESMRRPLQFLGTQEGLDLTNAYLRISDPTKRRRVLDLVRSLGDQGCVG